MTTRVQIIAAVTGADSLNRFAHLVDETPELPTLAAVLDKHGVEGGDRWEIELLDHLDTSHRVSLAAFADVDPDARIGLEFISGPVERRFPDLEPGAVLLKEYLLADPENRTGAAVPGEASPTPE